MKKNSLFIVSVLVVELAVAGCSSGPKTTDDGLFMYEKKKSEAGDLQITNYLGSDTSIIIPQYIGNRKVGIVAIGSNKNITSIVIPYGIHLIYSSFENYYLMNGREKGTYSLEDGNYFFNGKLLPRPACIEGFYKYITGERAGFSNRNGNRAFDYTDWGVDFYKNKWFFKPGTYNLDIEYFKTSGNSVSNASVVLRGIVLEEGKTYDIVLADATNQGELLGLGTQRVSIGIKERIVKQ